MKVLSAGVVAAAILFIGQFAVVANANEFCRSFIGEMDTGVLYVAKCLNRASCLEKVVTPGIGANNVLVTQDNKFETLEPGNRYNFIFKTAESLPRNSMVVVQTKRLNNPSRVETKPVDVQIRRNALNFSCGPFGTNVYESAWPPDDAKGNQVPSVSFYKYDQFHRYGYTAKEERSRLWSKFHVVYFNGSTCVSTLDAARRSQFLLYDRTNIPSKFVAFLERISVVSPSAAIAAGQNEMAKYEKIKVLLTNYQIVNQDSGRNPVAGCFGFSASSGTTKTSQLEISVSDLELNAPYWPLLDLTKTWTFDVKRNMPPDKSSR